MIETAIASDLWNRQMPPIQMYLKLLDKIIDLLFMITNYILKPRIVFV